MLRSNVAAVVVPLVLVKVVVVVVDVVDVVVVVVVVAKIDLAASGVAVPAVVKFVADKDVK